MKTTLVHVLKAGGWRPWCAAICATFTIAALLTIPATAYSTPVAPDATQTPAPTKPALDSATDSPGANDPRVRARESIDYLMRTYAVSEGEAIRRLELQSSIPDMVDRIEQAIGQQILDVALDQKGGGRVIFLTSAPEEARQALGAVASEHVIFKRSKHTRAELEAAAKLAREALAGIADTEVTVDSANEAIFVRYVGGDSQIAARVTRLFPAGQASNGVEVSTDAAKPELKGKQHVCTIFACDPVIRGGVRLHVRRDTLTNGNLDQVNTTWGSCTSGFNIRASNGAAFVLTAGHCVENPNLLTNKRTYMYHNGLPILVEPNASGSYTDPNAPPDNRFWENSPHQSPYVDYAFLPFDVTGSTLWHYYWFTNRPNHDMVFSQCITPSPNPCSSGSYGLSSTISWSSIAIGTVVCGTGSGYYDIYPGNGSYTPGTRCGVIDCKTMRNYDDCGGGRGIRVNICGRDGDSGGPLWSQLDGRAYGVLTGGPEKSGACSLSDPDDNSVYSPLADILAHVNGQTGLTLSLITASNG